MSLKILFIVFFCAFLFPNSIEYAYTLTFFKAEIPILYLILISTVLLLFILSPRSIKLESSITSILLLYILYIFCHTILSIIFSSAYKPQVLTALIYYLMPISIFFLMIFYRKLINIHYIWTYIIPVFVFFILLYNIILNQMSAFSIGDSWGSGRLTSGLGSLRRFSSPFGGPNLVAATVLLVLPYYLIRSFNDDSNKLMVATYISLSIIIILTFSRSSFVLFFLVHLYVFIYVSRRKKLFLLFFLGFGSIGVLQGLVDSRLFDFGVQDIEVIDEDSKSSDLRLFTYKKLLGHAIKDPVGIGVGSKFVRERSFNEELHQQNKVSLVYFDGAYVMYQPHSAWLLILVELGWVGFSLFLFFFMKYVNKLRKLSKVRGRLSGFDYHSVVVSGSIGVFTFPVWLLFSDSLQYNFRFALLAWGILGLYYVSMLNYNSLVKSLR